MLILRLYVYTLADKTSTEAPSTSCWTSYGTLICLHTGEFEVRHEIVSFSSVKWFFEARVAALMEISHFLVMILQNPPMRWARELLDLLLIPKLSAKRKRKHLLRYGGEKNKPKIKLYDDSRLIVQRDTIIPNYLSFKLQSTSIQNIFEMIKFW